MAIIKINIQNDYIILSYLDYPVLLSLK